MKNEDLTDLMQLIRKDCGQERISPDGIRFEPWAICH